MGLDLYLICLLILSSLLDKYITQIEAGDYNVTIDTLNKISNAFEISIAELVEGVEAEI